ncbi:MAG TPA: MarR family transcriptional regulator [Actinomycetota bacterium]
MATDAKLQAWFTFLQAHDAVVEALDQDLRERVDMPLADYEVVLHLGRADGGTLRMHELADAVLLSASGTTRAVDRLVHAGLVERVPDTADGRVTRVSLTALGRRHQRAAAPVHLAGVRARFLDALSPQQARDLRTSMRAILHANDRTERML